MFSLSKSLISAARFGGFVQRRNGTTISVILLDKIENRGNKGDIITVKRGFARNFLIPKKMAGLCNFVDVYSYAKFYNLLFDKYPAYATDANKIKYSQLIEVVPDYNNERLISLKDEVLVFARASTTAGNLFGSVTVADIAKYFTDKAVQTEKIEFENGIIKSLGAHKVNVDGVEFQVQVVEPPSVVSAQH